jgi:hypothetical protein
MIIKILDDLLCIMSVRPWSGPFHGSTYVLCRKPWRTKPKYDKNKSALGIDELMAVIWCDCGKQPPIETQWLLLDI